MELINSQVLESDSWLILAEEGLTTNAPDFFKDVPCEMPSLWELFERTCGFDTWLEQMPNMQVHD